MTQNRTSELTEDKKNGFPSQKVATFSDFRRVVCRLTRIPAPRKN